MHWILLAFLFVCLIAAKGAPRPTVASGDVGHNFSLYRTAFGLGLLAGAFEGRSVGEELSTYSRIASSKASTAVYEINF